MVWANDIEELMPNKIEETDESYELKIDPKD